MSHFLLASKSQGLQASYLSEVRKFAGKEINPEGFATCPGHLASWWEAAPGNKVSLSLLAVQDVDAAYMSKVDLQSKMDVLFGEVNFLKYLFQTVSSVLTGNPSLFSHLTRVVSSWVTSTLGAQSQPSSQPLVLRIPGWGHWRWEAGQIPR